MTRPFRQARCQGCGAWAGYGEDPEECGRCADDDDDGEEGADG